VETLGALAVVGAVVLGGVAVAATLMAARVSPKGGV